MDVVIVLPIIVFLLVLRYYITDHETAVDKDRKQYAEGIALYEAQDYKEAFGYFNQVLTKNRKSALAFAYRGKCNKQEENFHSALYDFTQALSYDNTLVEVHLNKGEVLYQLKEYNDAFLSFDKAVWFSRGKNSEAIRWRNLAEEKRHVLK